MKPGRELDALIAEKVMGWELREPPSLKGKRIGTWFKNGEAAHDTGHWSPSTDIAAAWEVVEKLTGEDRHFRIGKIPGNKPLEWHAEFFEGCNEYGVTAAHAICLAALSIQNLRAYRTRMGYEQLRR